MRRFPVLIMLVALVGLAMPANLLAARPERFSDTQTTLHCDVLTGPAGSAVAYVQVSEEWGGWSALNFWVAPAQPGEDPATWLGSSNSVVLSPDGTTLEAAFDLYENAEPGEEDPDDPVPVPTGEPTPTLDPGDSLETLDTTGGDGPGAFVGEATLSATLTESGDPVTQSFRDRNGNQLYRGEGSWQALSVTGSLSLPGNIAFDLSACDGSTEAYSTFSTVPATYVARDTMLRLQCTWQTVDGFVALDASVSEYGSWGDLYVEDSSGTYSGSGEAELTSSSFAMTIDLYSHAEEGGFDPVGSAQASARLAPDGRINESADFGGTRTSIKGTLLAVDGQVDLATPSGSRSLDMDGTACRAGDVRITQMSGEVHGPRLRNDGPDRAVALAIGDVASVDTGGAAMEPEAPCVAIDPESGELSEYPLGRTGWWTFAGTGGTVTIDTSSSDFDTMVGVYVEDAGAFHPVACVDDTEAGLQAVLSLDTSAGLTYFIQAGGYRGSAGHLVLSVNE